MRRAKRLDSIWVITTGHIPGAVFADPIAALSDRASGLRFLLEEWARDPSCPMESGPVP
jgi:3-mercaptopyruvate sulfurtransferase SseA